MLRQVRAYVDEVMDIVDLIDIQVGEGDMSCRWQRAATAVATLLGMSSSLHERTVCACYASGRLPQWHQKRSDVQFTSEAQCLLCCMTVPPYLQYNLVGMPGVSGLSVEQRKRLTIAVELVANPSVIFLVRQRERHSQPCLACVPCHPALHA
jgi:hypothetical protein